jgi:hypothetical protein
MDDIEITYKTNNCSRSLKVLSSSLGTIKNVAKVLAFLYISCGFLFLMTPLATYYFKGELGLIFEFYIPGLDYKTLEGYIITSCLHFLFVLCGVCKGFMFDLLFFVSFYHIVTLSELMKIKMEEIGEFLVGNDLKIPDNVKKVKDMMKEIFEQHSDMLRFVAKLLFPASFFFFFVKKVDLSKQSNFGGKKNYLTKKVLIFFIYRYINACNRMFNGQCATIMALASLIVTLSLSLVVTDSWIGGYAMIIPIVGQLFINSLFGTIATIQVPNIEGISP